MHGIAPGTGDDAVVNETKFLFSRSLLTACAEEIGENAHALTLEVRCSDTQRFHGHRPCHTAVAPGMDLGV